MHIRPRRCAVAAVFAFATAATAQTQHTIRLTRPVEIGHSYHVRATGSTDVATTTVTDGGPEDLGTIKMTATLDAVAEVINVDDAGRPTAIAYVVNECKMKQHTHAATIVPKGETLIARQGEDGQTRFFVKKKRFTDLEQQALESVAAIEVYQVSKDELFGTSDPQAVGGRWPIDAEKLAAEFQRYMTHRLDPGDIEGSTSLVDVIEYEGRPCQVIRTDLDARGPLPGFDQMPQGTRIKTARLKATTHDLLPLDMTQPPVADKLHVELDIVFAGRLGRRTVEGRMTGVIESEHTYTAVTTSQAAVEP